MAYVSALWAQNEKITRDTVVREVTWDWSPEVGTTLIEHFGTPSLELRNGIRMSTLGPK